MSGDPLVAGISAVAHRLLLAAHRLKAMLISNASTATFVRSMGSYNLNRPRRNLARDMADLQVRSLY